MRNKKPCRNNCFGSLEFCHLRTHNEDKTAFDAEMTRKLDEFNNSTLPKNSFTIVSINRDGACMFKCIAKYLIANLDNIEETHKDHHTAIKAIMDEYSNKNDIDEEVSEYVQSILKKWVVKNSENRIPKFDMSLRELIAIVHGEEGILTLEDYDEYFSIYAGDYDFIVETEMVNGKKVDKKIEIPERWGTVLELYAVHKIFDLNINIFLLKKFDKRAGKVAVCTNRSKEYRFYLSETFESESSDANTMNLYFNTMYGSSHYQLLLN
jgi:hypothetical protein